MRYDSPEADPDLIHRVTLTKRREKMQDQQDPLRPEEESDLLCRQALFLYSLADEVRRGAAKIIGMCMLLGLFFAGAIVLLLSMVEPMAREASEDPSTEWLFRNGSTIAAGLAVLILLIACAYVVVAPMVYTVRGHRRAALLTADQYEAAKFRVMDQIRRENEEFYRQMFEEN